MILFHAYKVEAGLLYLDADDSAHCVRVLRHKEGDLIDAMDGFGSHFKAVITDASVKETVARIVEEEKNFGAHPYHLVMGVCPTKNIDRFEWFVEKAVEIGVDRIVPLIGERSERKAVKTDRLRRLALSAAKQSLKGRVPEVSEAVSVKDFILEMSDFTGLPRADRNTFADTDSGVCPDSRAVGRINLVAYCDEASGLRTDVTEALARFRSGLPSVAASKVAVLIGPEGDFSPEEIGLSLSKGFVPVSLGSSRLRTETAALVAATAVYLEFKQ